MATDSVSSADPVYDAVAAFAAGLVEHGVTDVVISPGSRSTALALTLHAQPMLRTWIQLDERSAGFFALGQARRTGRPSVLVCTSGTAAANYLPAIIEAHHAGGADDRLHRRPPPRTARLGFGPNHRSNQDLRCNDPLGSRSGGCG